MKYLLGIQSFENIREDGYLYLDKTAMVYNLVKAGKYYFLSRPRRFGKCLLISGGHFRGKRELFEGLTTLRVPLVPSTPSTGAIVLRLIHKLS